MKVWECTGGGGNGGPARFSQHMIEVSLCDRIVHAHRNAVINPNGTTRPLGGKESGNVKYEVEIISYISIAYQTPLAERVESILSPWRCAI